MYYLGIDGGGTKCHAVIQNEAGETLGRGRGGPANPVHGYEQAIQSITDASTQAAEESGLSQDDFSSIVAGIGLAGVNLHGIMQKMESWQHRFAELHLTTDLEIASIGAHESNNGAVIVVGTGSCGYCMNEDNKVILGGYGFPIGDHASGAWMGLKAIEHTLLALDGFIEIDQLTRAVCNHFDATAAINLSEAILGSGSKRYGEIAPLIFMLANQNEPKALAIVNEGLAYISKLASKLLAHNPDRLSIIGGLSHLYMERLEGSLAEKFSPPLHSPEIGALLYGKNQSTSLRDL